MPSKGNRARKFRIVNNKYDDIWMFGFTFNIDWVDEDGKRDKYICIHLGRRCILIGFISQYEGD